jgi:tripartite-type tricarboxylate transporter receptor subunit TctC
VPAKTPKAIIEKLAAETAAAVRHPEIQKKLVAIAAEPVGSTPAEQDDMLRKQFAHVQPIVQQLGITMD